MSRFIYLNTHYNKKCWSVSIDGKYRTIIEQTLLKQDIPEYEIDRIFANAANILSQCPDPSSDEEFKKTGLAIGKVQSGKTSNFISLIALAFDNKYPIVVVLGGNKKNLLEQNTSRIIENFGEGSNEVVVISTEENKALIDSTTIKRFVLSNRPIIIMALKHQKHINSIAQIFEDKLLSKQTVLIIDDEGDQASLNTMVNKASHSAIYKSIMNLKNNIEKHSFLSVTATPQPNILIDTIDELSPDFGVLIDPGNGYTGGSVFHGDNQDIYIKEVPDNEASFLDDDGVPESFYEALSVFFVGAALRRYRGDYKKHAMLIHPSQKKCDHKMVHRKVKKVLDDWYNKATIGKSDICYDFFQRELKKGYDLLLEDGTKLPSFESLEPYVLQQIIACSQPHIVNSDASVGSDDKFFDVNIYVGGNMVERGITVKGLAVTYIIRRAKGIAAVDTTEQRARWFGYKNDYIDVCRVYTTAKIKQDFATILEHEEDLWSAIRYIEQQGIPFKEMKRVFILDSESLIPTRRNVAQAKKYKFGLWTIQDMPLYNIDKIQYNVNLVNKFADKNEEHMIIRNWGRTEHRVLKNVDFNEVKSIFFDKFYFPYESNINSEVGDRLMRQLEICNLEKKVDLWFMRYKNFEERTIKTDGTIKQLMQGYTPNANSITHYPGDRGVGIDSNAIQLQVHMVKPMKDRKNYCLADKNIAVPILALFIPEQFIEKMKTMISK